MTALKAVDLVDVWERGYINGYAERAQLLLSQAYADLSHDELKALPLGKRDDMLLQLREQIFGSRLESVVSCPNCNETLAINLDIPELRANLALGEDSATEWTSGDLWIRFRVPTGGNLLDLEKSKNREEARQRLLEHCVVEAHRGEEIIEPSQLTREETIALAERVARADSRGELMLNTKCPSCGNSWETLLDIAAFLWSELDVYVKRLATEVHALAWAYSWSERDILTMSARRRQIYLELVGR
jgi:ribosomal protein S27E